VPEGRVGHEGERVVYAYAGGGGGRGKRGAGGRGRERVGKGGKGDKVGKTWIGRLYVTVVRAGERALGGRRARGEMGAGFAGARADELR